LASVSYFGLLRVSQRGASGAPRPVVIAWLGVSGILEEVKETLTVELTIRTAGNRLSLRPEELWFDLGRKQERRQSEEAAARSYERVLEADPRHHLANLNLALLVAKRRDGGALRHAEKLFRTALEGDANSPGALWNLGLLLAHQGLDEGAAKLREGIQAAAKLGWSPRRLAMVLPLTRDGVSDYQEELQSEAVAFEGFCTESPALASTPELQRALPAALSDIRGLPEDPAWLVTWGVETAQLFGPQPRGASYGETLFASWRSVVARPAVASLLESARYEGGPVAFQAVVLGSALGYQCLFFRAVGIRCLGYDLLERSMVGVANAVVRKHGVEGVEFNTGDALTAPLPSETSLLWLNDEVWPSSLRQAVLRRAAEELCPGGVVVSYGPEGGEPPKGLRLVETFSVRTSWALAEVIRILRREP